MEQRLSGMETRLGDLRERVASLEAGAKYSMTGKDLAALEQRLIREYHEHRAAIASLASTLDGHIKQTAQHLEVLRYYRSLLTPILAGLAIWAITGNLDLTKVLLGVK